MCDIYCEIYYLFCGIMCTQLHFNKYNMFSFILDHPHSKSQSSPPQQLTLSL
jgi:hypothetical protein